MILRFLLNEQKFKIEPEVTTNLIKNIRKEKE